MLNDARGASADSCLFCKIVKGEIPSKKVYDDKDVVAFLDINPTNPGHTLVVPKKHADDLTKSSDDDIAKAMHVVRKITASLKEKMNAIGVNVLQNNGKAAGQIVAHTHFHIIPRYANDMVVISYPRQQIPEAAMEEIRKKLEDKPQKHDIDFDF